MLQTTELPPTRVKLCCSSRSYSQPLALGRLTQLEWIDLCAHELLLDGVDFDCAHFPRVDDDYLAQVKKLCVDRRLTVAAVSTNTTFGEGEIDPQTEDLKRWIDVAVSLGAPLLRFQCGAAVGSPSVAWRELVRGLKYACMHAKLCNVSLAMRPAAQSFVESPSDVKRALKETDSAWLRLDIGAGLLASSQSQDWAPLIDEAIIVTAPLGRPDTFGADEDVDYRRVLNSLWDSRYLGFVSIEYHGDAYDDAGLLRAIGWLRGMLAKGVA